MRAIEGDCDKARKYNFPSSKIISRENGGEGLD